jgi:pantoate--beta-alanine ligase
MGALHEGHLSLVERSRKENAATLVSIFVNPTQFNDPGDLEKYPRTFEQDLEMLNSAGADFLFYPKETELYPDGYRYQVRESELSRELCGAHRPGHFEGVLTVVMKLLNLADPDRAYFGEKDYQQLLLIQGMAKTFFMRTEVVACETVRESDGLAMSSRNRRLDISEREKASEFFRWLRDGKSLDEIRRALASTGFQVDYVEEKFGRRFGAVKLGEVRLIDNVRV